MLKILELIAKIILAILSVVLITAVITAGGEVKKPKPPSGIKRSDLKKAMQGYKE